MKTAYKDPADYHSNNGPPFGDLFELLLFLLFNRHREGDNVILISGAEGAGKSTLAITLIVLLKAVAEQLEFAPFVFNPEADCIYDYDDWEEAYDPTKENGLYLIDEGGNLLFSRDSQTGESKQIIKVLQQVRVLKNIVIMNLPHKNWIDIYVREHRSRIHIYCHSGWNITGQIRGYATVQWRSTYWRSDETTWDDAFDWDYESVEDTPEWRGYQRRKKAKLKTAG